MAVLNSTIITGDLSVSGTVTATTYNTFSDKDLKENLRTFVLNTSILDLPVYIYDYKASGMPKNQVGCLAQDLKEICPELVSINGEGFLTINEIKLVYPLLLEVKNQKTELKNLQEEIKKLKAEIEALRK